jgi:hypothetical protein
MDTLPEFISRNSGSQGMLFDKDRIRMATVAGSIDVGNMRQGFIILAGLNIMFPVAVKAVGCPFRSLHDHFGMETLQVLLFCLLVASSTIHPFVRGLLPALGVFVILNPGMAI